MFRIINSRLKAALVSFNETPRFEVKDDAGMTIAKHGSIRRKMSRGKFMVQEVEGRTTAQVEMVVDFRNSGPRQ